MSQLVRSKPRWSVMILIPDAGSVGRAMQRVPVAELPLARRFEWFGILEPRLCGCPGPGHQTGVEVRIDGRRPPSEAPAEGRCFLNLNQTPPLARHRAKISWPNRLSALLKLLSLGWQGRRRACAGFQRA